KTGADGMERAAAAAVDVFDRKIQLLQRHGWFGDLPRKRRALDKMLSTIRAASDPLLRDLYVARASEVAHISRDVLEREVAKKEQRPTPGHDPRAALRPAPRVDRPNAGERDLIRLLVHRREFLENIVEQISPEELQES